MARGQILIILGWNVSNLHQTLNSVYCKLAKVLTLATLGISSLWGSLLLGGRYFQGVVTLWEQNTLYKIDTTELTFYHIKDRNS